jgi:hypothetical protein
MQQVQGYVVLLSEPPEGALAKAQEQLPPAGVIGVGGLVAPAGTGCLALLLPPCQLAVAPTYQALHSLCHRSDGHGFCATCVYTAALFYCFACQQSSATMYQQAAAMQP